MNREIKFRGWELDEWVYFDLIHNGDVSEIDPETIGQYVGLKDKNGKEIYEGDIVNCKTKTEDINEAGLREVIFGQDYGFCYREPKDEDVEYNHGFPLNWGGYIEVEIIGNIHDNPELLK